MLLTNLSMPFETGDLMLQSQLALAKPFAPAFVTNYWTSSVNFSGGFGVALQRGVVLFTYTNQALNRKDDIVAENENGFAHEVLINYKSVRHIQHAGIKPYYQLSGGYTLLRTPVLYKESKLFPGDIDDLELLESSHAADGFSFGAGIGMTIELSDISMIYLELYGSTTFLASYIYPTLRARTGVLFQLGN